MSVFRYFIRMFVSVLSRCCICLQWFLNVFLAFFVNVSDACSSVSCDHVFICTLQLLLVYVLKVDRVLHMECVWKAAGSTDDIWGSVGDVRNGAGPLLVRSLASPTC
jgi:hypothetical protein